MLPSTFPECKQALELEDTKSSGCGLVLSNRQAAAARLTPLTLHTARKPRLFIKGTSFKILLLKAHYNCSGRDKATTYI